MEKITFNQIQKSKITNQRQLVIKDCLDRINLERKGTKYKPTTGRIIALKLSHMSTEDIKYHHAQCLRAKGYSRLFFGLLKANK